jgi:hypothetical protein
LEQNANGSEKASGVLFPKPIRIKQRPPKSAATVGREVRS